MTDAFRLVIADRRWNERLARIEGTTRSSAFDNVVKYLSIYVVGVATGLVAAVVFLGV